MLVALSLLAAIHSAPTPAFSEGAIRLAAADTAPACTADSDNTRPSDAGSPRADSSPRPLRPARLSVRAGISAFPPQPGDADTVPRRARPRPVEYSDWYDRRLAIHRWASYATLPLFAAQYVVGERILQGKGGDQLRATHGALAGGVAVLFGLNTVTGLPNLWEARNDPAGRRWRTAHALLMLAADAGFVATGASAGDDDFGEDGFAPVTTQPRRATTHRALAIASMSTALVGYVMMLPPFRRD